jgi:hypothetical protein
MNIVYLIGNGFDLSLGMETRYTDFYKHYCKLDPSEQDSDVIKLKKSINKGKEDWKDLELQFGQYTKMINDTTSLQSVVFNLTDHLRAYLKSQQDILSADELNQDVFIDHLVHPEIHSNAIDGDAMSGNYPSNQHIREISIISFNYTDTIEKIIGQSGKMTGRDGIGRAWSISSDIYHIHGTLDNTILLGVNDVSQIANESFATNQDCLDLIVKPEANANSIRNNVDVKSKQLINESDLIVLFGLSIGETDKIWWQEIGNRLLRKESQVVIFSYQDDCIGGNKGLLIGSRARKIRKRFLVLAGLEGKEEEWRDRIFVEINRDMFSGIIQQ